MSHNRLAHFRGPSLLGQNFVSDEGMFFGAGIFFVIKIVQQTGYEIGLAQGAGVVCDEPESGRLLFAMSAHAGLNSERMFEQTWRLRVLIEQGPGFGSRISYFGH